MTPRELDFADSFESSAAPTAGFTVASSIKSFVDDAAFVTAKGSAASAGDIYHNTTSNQVREYNGSAWREIVASEGAQTIAGDKTFSGSMVVTGDLTVNGTTTTINTQTLDVEDAQITVNKGGTQATANAQDAGLLVEMSDATDVMIGYDSTLASRFKAGDVGSEAEVATVSHTQTLTNKTIDADQNTITNIENADIKAGAAIERSKIANGTADHVVINSAGGAFSSEANLSISRGGTGQGTQTAAFNALSPVTTKGDIIVRDTTNNIRLAVGTDGHILTADSAQASGVKWAAPSAAAPNLAVTSKTANYTATLSDDVILCDATSGGFTITLPTAVGNTGKVYHIKRTDMTLANVVTIDGDGTETIDGATTRLLHTQYEEWTITSNGANWDVLSHKTETPWSAAAALTPQAVSVNPTITTGTVYNIFQWKRIGQRMIFQWAVKITNGGGANGTGIYKIPLPSGTSINTTDVRVMSYISGNTLYDEGQVLGSAILKNSATVNNAFGQVYPFDSTFLAIGGVNFNNVWNSGFVGLNNGAGTISVSMKAEIPIANWEA